MDKLSRNPKLVSVAQGARPILVHPALAAVQPHPHYLCLISQKEDCDIINKKCSRCKRLRSLTHQRRSDSLGRLRRHHRHLFSPKAQFVLNEYVLVYFRISFSLLLCTSADVSFSFLPDFEGCSIVRPRFSSERFCTFTSTKQELVLFVKKVIDRIS